ncbi:PH domain-containing protein [Paenibacillus yanchengensis]|uniref:PH domain-containing protein n=1 Tax=Paenibacillus yanchengensis TaxID=2035833 RepID=A0ABW4YJ79_9BACL
MLRTLSKKLHPDYFKVYRISNAILHGILGIVLITYFVFVQVEDWSHIPLLIATPLWLVSFLYFGLVTPAIMEKVFRYELFDDELEIKSGVIFLKNVLVPMVRVQHVEISSGPLMRKHDLASVEVVTAATTHKIVGLKLLEAEMLKRRIGQLARVSEDEN